MCPTLSDPMDWSLPGSSIHGILVPKGEGRGEYSQNKMFVNSLCFPGGSVVKNPLAMQETSCNGGHVGWTLGWGRSPGENYSNPLQYSCHGKSHGQRSLAGYSPWGHKRVQHNLATKIMNNNKYRVRIRDFKNRTQHNQNFPIWIHSC